jgi:hypothetical protein
MRVDIIVVYVPRYKFGHEKHFVPPVTGIHLAALTPPEHQVRVIHQQVEPVPLDTDADLVGSLSSVVSLMKPIAWQTCTACRGKW